MAISLSTRKPVNLLGEEDFAAYPLWEYASNEERIVGRDETWVRPVDSAVVRLGAYVHVAAEFVAACGRQFSGNVTVSTLEGHPETCQGSIFHNQIILFISNPEAFGFRKSRDKVLIAVSLGEHELFPLSFRLKVPVEGVPGFWGGILP